VDRRFLHETLHHNIDRVLDKQITILGCGAIGANLAISLVRRGFKNFWLVDFDKIEEHNLSTQPWLMQDLGRNKASTLGSILYMIARVQGDIFPREFSYRKNAYTNDMLSSDLFIDCFDNHDSRKQAQDLHDLRKNVVHVGMSNQNTGEVVWDVRYKVPPDIKLDDPCNYPLSRTLIELTVVAASEAVLGYFLSNARKDYFIHADSLRVSRI
jgi:hypothetical protein